MYCRKFASVAHLDRAAASDAACGGFESRQAHQPRTRGGDSVSGYPGRGHFLPRCPESGYTFCNAITGAERHSQ